MHNIQKHPVKPGTYVGHATGTWHIKRVGTRAAKSWRGVKVSGAKFECDPPAITGRTLLDISKALDSLNIKIKAELAAHDQAVAAVKVEMERDTLLPNAFMHMEGE